MSANDSIHRTPPPGTEIVKTGTVQAGDWFFIESMGAWAPVPKIGIGEPVTDRLIARGTVDNASVNWTLHPLTKEAML